MKKYYRAPLGVVYTGVFLILLAMILIFLIVAWRSFFNEQIGLAFLVLGIYLFTSFFIFLPWKYRLKISKKGIIQVPGFPFKRCTLDNNYHFSLFPRKTYGIYFNFLGSNIKKVYFVGNQNSNQLWQKTSGIFKDQHSFEHAYVDDPKNTICIEFKKSLKYKINKIRLCTLDLFYHAWAKENFPDLGKVYVSVKDPQEVVRILQSLI